MFKTSEELLDYPTPFWLRNNNEVVLCVEAGWKKDTTAIAFKFVASYSGNTFLVYDFKYMPAVMSSKWNQQEVVEHPDPDGLRGIIRVVFTDD